MADADIYSLFMGDELTAHEQAKALAEALRGRRKAAADNLGLGLITSLGANPLLAGLNHTAMAIGQQLGTDADRQETLLAQAGQQNAGNILRRALAADAAQKAEANAQRAREWHLSDAETQRTFQAGQNALGRTAQVEAARIASERQDNRHPPLPAEMAAGLGNAESAIEALKTTGKEWDAKASNTLAAGTQFWPGSEANLYRSGLKARAQVIGKFLEGGKMTDADVPRYMSMLPQPEDTKEKRDYKERVITELIANKRAADLKALQQAGYRTGGFDAAPATDLTAPPTPPPAAQGVRMKGPQGQVGTVDPSEVAEAEANGWKRM